MAYRRNDENIGSEEIHLGEKDFAYRNSAARIVESALRSNLLQVRGCAVLDCTVHADVSGGAWRHLTTSVPHWGRNDRNDRGDHLSDSTDREDRRSHDCLLYGWRPSQSCFRAGVWSGVRGCIRHVRVTVCLLVANEEGRDTFASVQTSARNSVSNVSAHYDFS
jgi:hypothetical protein